jgi:hypothetical protein
MGWTGLIERGRAWMLSSGAGQNPDSESQDRFFHYSVFLLLGVPTMLAFGGYHFNAGNYRHSMLVFGSATSLIFGWQYLWRTGNGNFFYRFNGVLFALLLLEMMTFGEAEGAKILWMYTFPLISLFLLGKQEGLYWAVGLLLIALIIFFYGQSQLATIPPYSANFKLRFVLSYLIVTSIAYWFEHLRAKYRRGYERKARQLQEEKLLLEENLAQLSQTEKEKDFLIETLQRALEEVNTLRGLLPICCHCNKIRDDAGFWNRLESYLEERAAVTFTHGICPDCKELHYPGFGKHHKQV